MGDLVLLDNERRKRRIAAEREAYEAERAHRRGRVQREAVEAFWPADNPPGAA